MSEKKIIIRCAGKIGRQALKEYGEKVAYFCDDYCEATQIEGVPVIRTDRLREIHQDYQVMIALTYMEQRIMLAEEMRKQGIPSTAYGHHEVNGVPHCTIRIHGTVDHLEYEFNDLDLFAEIDQIRTDNTMAMYREMFRVYHDDFAGKNIDIWVDINDSVQQTYEFSKIYGLNTIHAYSTVFALNDVVIPIPDYRACFNEETYFYTEASPEKCRAAAAAPYEDPRAYWIGSTASSEGRMNLWVLARKYPDHLLVESSFEKWVPMPEQAKYKYLIDVRGFGWTDRLKTLLMLGRPLLLVDRPNVEWYMKDMVPMKHYVPIKEDLSDLIEKIEFLNAHEEIYMDIVENAKLFVKEYLAPEKILKYLRDVTLRYDTMDAQET